LTPEIVGAAAGATPGPNGGLHLLTGGTGFVGRQILRSLLKAGCRVRVVVRSSAAFSAEAAGDNVEVVVTENIFRESREGLARIVDGTDTLIHAAWYAEPGQYLQSPLNLDCLAGTMELARAFQASGGRRFVGVGTCFEYDLSVGYLRISTPLRPETPYAACKAAAFFSLSSFFEQSGVEFAWCRLFYLFGEGEDERRLVPKLHARLAAGESVELTTGAEVRDYIDVRDAGSIIAGVATGDIVGPVNVCSGVPVTIRQLAEGIADRYGARDLLRWGIWPNDAPFIVGEVGPGVDPSRVRTKPDFDEPRIRPIS